MLSDIVLPHVQRHSHSHGGHSHSHNDDIDMERFSDYWWGQWNPNEIKLTSDEVSTAWKTCVLSGTYFGEVQPTTKLGARISSIFVIFITSLLAALFPIIARRAKWMRIPKSFYFIARHFGSGVILATAFIHLMEHSYAHIGSTTCVGMTGNWSIYPWTSAIMLAGATFTFLIDSYSSFFVEFYFSDKREPEEVHSVDPILKEDSNMNNKTITANIIIPDDASSTSTQNMVSFRKQISGFIVLEFGIIFHSVMIGLMLGSESGFSVLYPVIVFHQIFEGLGIGSRLSMIPFPEGKVWYQYFFSVVYSLATPIAVAIGIGVRESYNSHAFTTLVVQGVLDAISAGILFYTAFVELIARDFIFLPQFKTMGELTIASGSVLVGAGLMALLGKWA